MDWSIICSDKRKGGLGVRNLALLNKASYVSGVGVLRWRGKLCEGKLFVRSKGKKRAVGGPML